ncbi:hypothetical protein [Bordetella tumulicola]|uniref:hypothetical protein n=1 Tax=Bordetella tumulicola TaxID=1649133 RepID=UPI0039EFEF9A
MTTDGEPKDGDFVRYIQRLNSPAGHTPGEVSPRKGFGGLLNKQKTAEIVDSPESVYSYMPIPDAAPPPSSRKPSRQETTTDDQDPETATLASRSANRTLSFGLKIAGAIALWSAISKLLTATNNNALDTDSLIPVVFLFVCAYMLFKGSRAVGKKQDKPLAKFSPLAVPPIGKKPRR